MNLKIQERITGNYCKNYHRVVLGLCDQFMTHRKSHGFEPDVSWAKKFMARRIIGILIAVL